MKEKEAVTIKEGKQERGCAPASHLAQPSNLLTTPGTMRLLSMLFSINNLLYEPFILGRTFPCPTSQREDYRLSSLPHWLWVCLDSWTQLKTFYFWLWESEFGQQLLDAALSKNVVLVFVRTRRLRVCVGIVHQMYVRAFFGHTVVVIPGLSAHSVDRQFLDSCDLPAFPFFLISGFPN